MPLALIPFFFACNDPNDFGVELDDENSKTETLAVEFTLPARTMFIDSLVTSSTDQLLFGRIEGDSTFGSVKARGILEYAFFSQSQTLPEDTLEFSKAFIRLKYSKALVLSQTNSRLDIILHEAQDSLFSTVQYMYNSPIAFDDTKEAGSVSQAVEVYGDSIVEISLSDELGLSLFNKLKLADSDNGDYLDSLNNELYFYPPLVLEPGVNNQSLFTFNMTLDTVGLFVEMRHPVSGEFEYYKFSVREKKFTQIARNRTGSKYEGLTKAYDFYNAEESTVKLNVVAGLYPLIELYPYLNFLDSSENIIIDRARLTIGNEPLLLPLIPPVENIRYLFAGANNVIDGAGALGYTDSPINHAVLSNSGYINAGSTQLTSSDLLTTTYIEDDQNYVADITFFSQFLLDNRVAGEDYLSTKLVLYNSNIHNVGYSTMSKSDIKLKVFYTKLK